VARQIKGFRPRGYSPPYALADPHGANPVSVFRFWIEVKSIVVAQFQECSGLRLERHVEEIEEGGVNDRWHILPGRIKQSNIVLKYGLLDSDVAKMTSLWEWFRDGRYDGKVTKVNFSILLYGLTGESPVRRWEVDKGFPVKWEGPSLNVESGQVAIETLEIAHEGLRLSGAT
jgi:phage tail-like protein